eukprot:scaffold4869_cov123-Isochrysis_galbana.AAC.6
MGGDRGAGVGNHPRGDGWGARTAGEGGHEAGWAAQAWIDRMSVCPAAVDGNAVLTACATTTNRPSSSLSRLRTSISAPMIGATDPSGSSCAASVPNEADPPASKRCPKRPFAAVVGPPCVVTISSNIWQ